MYPEMTTQSLERWRVDNPSGAQIDHQIEVAHFNKGWIDKPYGDLTDLGRLYFGMGKWEYVPRFIRQIIYTRRMNKAKEEARRKDEELSAEQERFLWNLEDNYREQKDYR
jgi:hypothetical protein